MKKHLVSVLAALTGSGAANTFYDADGDGEITLSDSLYLQNCSGNFYYGNSYLTS